MSNTIKKENSVRRTGLMLALMAILVPLAGWGAVRGLSKISGDPLQWVANDAQPRAQFDWFVDRFDSADSLLVSWPGCRVDDARLDRFAEAVRGRIAGGEKPGCDWFLRVVTGREMLGELVRPPLELSLAEAIERLDGTFVGPDGRTTCAVIMLSDAASPHAREVVRTIREIAQGSCGVRPEEVCIAGALAETATIDEASLETLLWLSVPSALLAIAVAWTCLKSLRLTLLVYFAAVVCQVVSLAMVHYTGGSLNGMACLMPVLVLVVFVSGSVHLINYYQDAAPRLGRARAAAHALRVGWFPCTLAVVTSAIGVASLWPSPIEPISSFGLYAAIGMVVALGVLLLVLPNALCLASGRRAAKGQTPSEAAAQAAPQPASALCRENTAGPVPSHWLAAAVARHHAVLAALCVLAAVVGAFGLARVSATMRLTDFLPRSGRCYREHVWLENNVGPLLPAEAVLRFTADSKLSMNEKVRVVRDVEAAARSACDQVSTVSVATMLPDEGPSGSFRGTVRRTMVNRRLAAERKRLAATPYLRLGDEEELWRVTIRVEGLSRQSDGSTLAKLQNAVCGAVADARRRHGEAISVAWTGMVPLLAESHTALLTDLGRSCATAVVLIGVLLALGLRSVRLGLVSMLPNMFPVVVVFGVLGWLGCRIDVGTMMTASVGMGIAVDDTVHFLTWFTRGLKQGLTRRQALAAAYAHCTRAMLRTTLICGAGLGVYALSPFPPAAQFGWVTCVLLLTALVGDLVFLPALIAGPLGAVLFPERGARRTSIRDWLRLGERLVPAPLRHPLAAVLRRPFPAASRPTPAFAHNHATPADRGSVTASPTPATAGSGIFAV